MNDKYKMFRNFMFNELGITKEDIKEWTKEAIDERVEKLIGQMNVEQMINNTASRILYNSWNLMDAIKKDIETELAKKIDISVLK